MTAPITSANVSPTLRPAKVVTGTVKPTPAKQTPVHKQAVAMAAKVTAAHKRSK